MELRDRILDLLAQCSGRQSNGAEDSDVLGAFGLTGDDASDFLALFETEFKTDLSAMIWYFHFNADEPPTRRRIVPHDATTGRPIPYDPITLDDLVKAAKTGEWVRDYPKHSIGQSILQRYAMTALALALMVGLLVYATV